MHFTQIQTPRLRIRRFQMEDLPAFLQYRSDEHVARFQSWNALSEEQAIDYIAAFDSVEPGQIGDGFQFALALRANNRLIGDAYLRLLDYDLRQAEIGYTLERSSQGYGYATEMLHGLLPFLFEELGLHRVLATVDQENLASARLLERVGFRREGVMLQSFYNKGSYRDEFQYALLAQEWASRSL